MNKKNRQQTRKKVPLRAAQSQKRPSAKQPAPQPTRLRLWLFRFVGVFVIPVLLLLGLEMGLRVFDYGVPTGFTFKQKVDGQTRILSNPYFTWRFFPPQLARESYHFSLPLEKTKGTYRVFVLGASAAQGDPEAAYGITRMLQTMLRDQYPSVDFDVINAAITAINSHVVLPIARDVSRLDPDLFVVYLGNNEVVGPYGAGTVFSPLVSNLSVIRAGIALKTTRFGQLVPNIIGKLPGRHQTQPGGWRGMKMFLNHQVRAADPGMAAVYHHFEENLTDICRVAQESGIPVIVSTVGVNLKDSSPFASLHDPTLSKQDIQAWERLVSEGETFREQGMFSQALKRFLKAETIDAGHAELHFRMASCYWAMWDFKKAKARYVKARELDTLRFRADTRINRIIRRVAGGKPNQGIYLVDSQQLLEDNSPEQIPGKELFYEHVHLNFHGNYLVARTIFEQVQELLPEWISLRASGDTVLSEQDCAQQLAYTGWNRLAIAKDLLQKLKAPPFTNQLYANEREDTLTKKIEALENRYSSEEGKREVLAQYKAALVNGDPHWHLLTSYSRLQFEHYRNARESEKHLREALKQSPQSAATLWPLGSALSAQGKHTEAEVYYRKALMYNPRSSTTLSSFGTVLLERKEFSGAITYLEDAVTIDPRNAIAQSNLGKAIALRSDDPGSRQQAHQHLKKAVDIDPENTRARENLAAFYHLEAMELAAQGNMNRAEDLLKQAFEWVPGTSAERADLKARLNRAGNQRTEVR